MVVLYIMAHPYEIKERAIELRRRGYSLNEIVRIVEISKSTVQEWVRSVELDDAAKACLLTKIEKGQLVSRENKTRRIRELMSAYCESALLEIQSEILSPTIGKIICAMIYWCEGGKDHYEGVRFTNSDPKLVATFLMFLRKYFSLDESKFRVCIHLHAYHDPVAQLDFWSKVTDIKKEQFIKPYRRQNTGKRTREGYQGCVSIYYHSNDIVRQLLMIAKAFFSVYK